MQGSLRPMELIIYDCMACESRTIQYWKHNSQNNRGISTYLLLYFFHLFLLMSFSPPLPMHSTSQLQYKSLLFQIFRPGSIFRENNYDGITCKKYISSFNIFIYSFTYTCYLPADKLALILAQISLTPVLLLTGRHAELDT